MQGVVLRGASFPEGAIVAVMARRVCCGGLGWGHGLDGQRTVRAAGARSSPHALTMLLLHTLMDASTLVLTLFITISFYSLSHFLHLYHCLLLRSK
jgi:hypothetical protein